MNQIKKKGRKRSKITTQDEVEIVKLYNDNFLSIKEIGDLFNVHRTTICYYLKKSGIKKTIKRNKKVKKEKELNSSSTFKKYTQKKYIKKIHVKKVKMYKDYITEERLREAKKSDALFKARIRTQEQKIM